MTDRFFNWKSMDSIFEKQEQAQNGQQMNILGRILCRIQGFHVFQKIDFSAAV